MAFTRYYEEIRRYVFMENIVKIIASQTHNLTEFTAMQTKLNDCIIKKIGSMQGQIKTNTFLIGCIIGYLIVTRKK